MKSLLVRTAIVCMLALSATNALALDVTRMVKDVSTIGAESEPEEFIYIAPYTYFTAVDDVYGYELWKSDGTEGGTQLVVDLRPGPNSSEPYGLTEYKGMLYFSATDGTTGRELWRTDGTEKGTVLVKDILTDPVAVEGDGPGSDPSNLTVSNGSLFFSASDDAGYGYYKGPSTTGRELWKTNGTEEGTVFVADILPGSSDSFPENLTDVMGTLFFTAWVIDPEYYYKGSKGPTEIPPLGRELWTSDGTEEGTQLVLDIYSGGGGSSPQNLIAMGSTLFFSADTGHSVNGRELWRSDGTVKGTFMIKDILPGQSGSSPSEFVVMDGILYFRASDGDTGDELWRSDGTEKGTFRVKDINLYSHGKGSNQGSQPGSFEVIGTTLYFHADDGIVGRELWRSDGTEKGTKLVKNISTTAVASKQATDEGSGPRGLTNVGGTLFFSASSAGVYDSYKTSDEKGGGNGDYQGTELWKSDGTEDGTVLVKAINPPYGSQPDSLTNANGTLYFAAADPETLHEPWTSDGTSEGTVRLKDINQSTADSSVNNLVRIPTPDPEDRLIAFRLGDQTYGSELWKSDGTEDGTDIIRDIVPGKDHSSPRGLTVVETKDGKILVFFSAFNAALPYYKGPVEFIGRELWVSDLTAKGTHLVEDIRPGERSSDIGNMIAHDGLLFFTANDGSTGTELWKSDGTVDGTERVLDIREGSGGSSPSQLTVSGGTLFFRANDGTSGTELWSTDGTTDGTQLLKNIRPDPGHATGSNPTRLTDVNGTLFFRANDGETGTELWKSNGTEKGTVRVKDLSSGSSSSNPSELVNVGGTLFFQADDGSGGAQLWKSDGESDGTVMVKTIYAQPPVSKGESAGSLGDFIDVDGTLFFTADDGVYGRELWKSDGTDKGTVMVADLAPGEDSSFPNELTNMDGVLYFEARDGGDYHDKADTLSGPELWRSDGTEEGTVMVAELFPGDRNPYINDLTPVHGMLFFSARDDSRGEELWATFQAPVVSFINRQTEEFTNDEVVSFTVRFDEEVGDVVADDFVVDVSKAKGGISGAFVVEVLGTGPSRTVNVNTGAGDGSISVDFKDADGSVTDAHGFTPGDAGASTFTDGAAYTIDKTAPALKVDVLATTDSTPPLSGTVDDPDVVVTIRLQGQTYTAENLEDGTWTLEDNTIDPPLADGRYTVNLEADDAVGNRGISTSTLQLTIDTTPPVITLNGDPGVVLVAGVDTYNEPGASAEDNIDGPVNVVIGGDAVDDDTPGLYIVTYTAVDSLGNSSMSSRTVLVNEAPVEGEGEGEGAGGGDDQLCVFLPNIEIQLLSFVTEFSVMTDDFDLDELPEFFAIDLEGEIVCADAQDSLWQATVNAFAINLTVFDGDTGAEGLEEFREVIAALMGISQATQLALLAILDDNGFVLEGEYVSVACETTDLTNCTPAAGPGKALFDEFEVLEPGQKGTTEPYSGPGDIDNDGTSNADEYANTVTAGGGLSDFISAVLDPTNDGSEIAGTGGCGAGSDISFTASRGDLFLLAMVALMLAIVRRLLPGRQR